MKTYRTHIDIGHYLADEHSRFIAEGGLEVPSLIESITRLFKRHPTRKLDFNYQLDYYVEGIGLVPMTGTFDRFSGNFIIYDEIDCKWQTVSILSNKIDSVYRLTA